MSRHLAFFQKVPGGGKGLALVAAAFALGILLSGGGDGAPTGAATAVAGKAQSYTCSMHPQINLPRPGRCPICGMELIPVTGGGGNTGGPRQLVMSAAAKRLAEVRTSPVERRQVVKVVRLVGKLDYDETKLRTITAWVPGRLDRLYIDYTGVAVLKGAKLVWLYSPELLVAQETLLQADLAYEGMKKSTADARNLAMQAGLVKSAEDRLQLWGLTDKQITEIRARGTAEDHMTILSPISGIVTSKETVEGDYVKVGTKIYEIADLSRLWLYLDAYESDLAWIRYAQQVEFEAEAYPGEVFRGRISFIDPFLDEMTRTVRIRVTVDNIDFRLKPGMFVRARIHARIAKDGRIVEPSLAGKWISPHHPEQVLDAPGLCPICETPTVSAESLGYVGADAPAPLVIPATAPLRTGKRAIVYVKLPDTDQPTFEGREVVLGPRTMEDYIVVSGLKEGEIVVTQGVFKIDSALQIMAKQAMMSPTDREVTQRPVYEVPATFVESLSPIYHAAFRAQRALAAGEPPAAREAAGAALEAVNGVDMRRVAGAAHTRWMALRSRLLLRARLVAKAEAIDVARGAFKNFSEVLLETVQAFGQATGVEMYQAHCPMAFSNRGGSWLADTKESVNPYLGPKMADCVTVERIFPPSSGGPRVSVIFREALAPFYEAILGVQRALAADDLAAAKRVALLAARALDAVHEKPGPSWMESVWFELQRDGATAGEALAQAADIEQARAAFSRLSGLALGLLGRFGHAREVPLHEAFCSMAFGGAGARWVQEGEAILNPYLGTKMPGCGEFRRSFAPSSGRRIPKRFREGISTVVGAYLDVAEALASDDLAAATMAAANLDDSFANLQAVGLDPHSREQWRGSARALREATATLLKATEIEAARRPFALLSDTLSAALATFGHAGPADLVEARCPMAFGGRGASWIQRGDEIRNPYFGEAMSRCGDVTRRFAAKPEE